MLPRPLTSCPCAHGTDLVVCAINCEAEHKLRDIGLREGATVAVLNNGGNVIVRVAGCRIGLRRELAACVLVTPARL